MSIHVMSWVFKHSEATLGARLVLLVLADHAKDDGSSAWPSVDTMSREARMSRRAVQDALRRLEQDGCVQAYGTHKTCTTVYRVIMGGADSAPVQISANGGAVTTPEPSVNHPLPVKRAPAHKTVRYAGKAVDPITVVDAMDLLKLFNEQAGRKLEPWRQDGRPSPHLREIIGAMLDRPGTEQAEWEAAVRHVFANPPRWVTDEGRQIQIGDVFGKRAADHALSNSGVRHTPAGRAGRASASELLRKLGD